MKKKNIFQILSGLLNSNSDWEKLKATDKAIRTMSKKDQDRVDEKLFAHRQEIGELDNLVDTYNRVYGTKMKLTFEYDSDEIIIDNVWSNSFRGIRKKILKPLGLDTWWGIYDEGEQYLQFVGWSWNM